MAYKTCSLCKETKDIDRFSVRSRPRQGISSVCKPCDAARSAEWRRNNPDRRQASISRYKAENPERVRESMRRWTENNKEYKKAAAREWRRLNSTKISTGRSRKTDAIRKGNLLREERVRAATPSWLTRFQKREILLRYILAQAMTDVHGRRYSVDHIMPIKGANSCGLHVPWNLQVIDNRANAQKKNALPDAGLWLSGHVRAGYGLPDGSFYVPPYVVEALGEGDHGKGCAVLDEFVTISRRQAQTALRAVNKRGRL